MHFANAKVPFVASLVVLVLLCTAPVGGTPTFEFWVAPSGPNGDGSLLTPFTSVAAAMNAAIFFMDTNHVVLHFHPGTYFSPSSIDGCNKIAKQAYKTNEQQNN